MEPFSPSPVVKFLAERQDVRKATPMPESPLDRKRARMSIYGTPPPNLSSNYPTPPDRYMGGMGGKPFDPRRSTPVAPAPPKKGAPSGEKLAGEHLIEQQGQQQWRPSSRSYLGYLDIERGLTEHSDYHPKTNVGVPFGSPGSYWEGKAPPFEALAQSSSGIMTTSDTNGGLDRVLVDEKAIKLVADRSDSKRPSEGDKCLTSIACGNRVNTPTATSDVEFNAHTQSPGDIFGLFWDKAPSSADGDEGIERVATLQEASNLESKSRETVEPANVAPLTDIETAGGSCKVLAMDDGLMPSVNQSECTDLVRRPDPPAIFASDATSSRKKGTRHVSVDPEPALVRTTCGAAPSAGDRSSPVLVSLVFDNASDNKENMLPGVTEHLMQESVSSSSTIFSKVDNLCHGNVNDEFQAPSPSDSPLVGDDSGSIEEEEKTFKILQPWILDLFGPSDEGTTDHDYVGKRIVSEYDAKCYLGTIVRYFRDYEVELGVPLWHVFYDDGDRCDMEEFEVKEVLRIYEKDNWKTWDPSSNHYNPIPKRCSSLIFR